MSSAPKILSVVQTMGSSETCLVHNALFTIQKFRVDRENTRPWWECTNVPFVYMVHHIWCITSGASHLVHHLWCSTFSDASLIHPPSSYLISLSHIIFKNIGLVGSFSNFVFVFVFVFVFLITASVIFDILEPPAFQKYNMCWVF